MALVRSCYPWAERSQIVRKGVGESQISMSCGPETYGKCWIADRGELAVEIVAADQSVLARPSMRHERIVEALIPAHQRRAR